MSLRSVLVCVALVFPGLWMTTSALRWLSLASLASVDHFQMAEGCSNLTGLVKRQQQICRRNTEVMEAVRAGAVRAIDECQYQFRNRRWNCSTVQHGSAIFGNVLDAGTREAAFVHAISAASVTHAVTRACSTGHLRRCGCDRTIRGTSPEGFEWAGCSDNVAYGSAFCKTFVDARERNRRSSRTLMNLHNNEAGRKIITSNMRIQCKCHGVSGSCELKTCWRAMPSFREVGTMLKDKFDGATEVVQKRLGSRRVLAPSNEQFKPHTDSDLVYVDASPDYCEFDAATGSFGTYGRLCNRTSKAIDGCELMCCGRGFNTRRKVEVERCHCKFHWCCQVKCQKCRREVDEHVCR